MSLASDLDRWAVSPELGPMQAAALIIGAAPDRQAIEDCREAVAERDDDRSRELLEILDSALSLKG